MVNSCCFLEIAVEYSQGMTEAHSRNVGLLLICLPNSLIGHPLSPL